MKPMAKIVCAGIALGWLQGAAAGGVTVSEQNGSVVLELVAPPDAAPSAPAQAGAPGAAPPVTAPPVQTQPGQGAAPVTRVPVEVHYERVDRANIEKRMADRAARTQKRKADAEKDAAERAARAQSNQTAGQQGQGAQGQ